MGAVGLSPIQKTIERAIVEWNKDRRLLPLLDDVQGLSYAIEREVHAYLKAELGKVIRRSGE